MSGWSWHETVIAASKPDGSLEHCRRDEHEMYTD